jgi:pimeloyl-ACP methyl ester carboxylesterase
MTRASEDDNAVMVGGFLHGDGLTAGQWRERKGADMQNPDDDVWAPKRFYQVIQLERRGNTFIVRAAHQGEPLQEISSKELTFMPEETLTGIVIGFHDVDVIETARAWNVRIDQPVDDSYNPNEEVTGDPQWRDGDYYDAGTGGGPHRGLALARRVGQIHYRSEQEFARRFGRQSVETLDRFAPWQRFQVESYLDHHGWKLTRRFDANSYLVLNKAMDLHDIGRGRGGVRAALARIKVPTMTVSIDSDFLYPPYQQYEVRDGLRSLGVDVTHLDVHSDAGHDGFLVEPEAIGPAVASFLARAAEWPGATAGHP